MLSKVYPITRAMVDTQFTDTLSNGSHVTGQTVGEAENTRRDSGFGASVF